MEANQIAKLAQIASALEVSGYPKPGNVHRTRNYDDMAFEDFIISGVVIGDITAPDSIKLMSSSAVIGDVSTRKLQVAEKVVLHGHCISILEEERYENEFSVQSQSKEIRNKAFVR